MASKVSKKRKIISKLESQPSTPSGSASSDDESFTGSHNTGKLSVRKETEQRRRNMMNQHFDELVMMLSMVTDRVTPKKMDKTSILEEVVRVVQQYYDLDKSPTLNHVPEYRPGFFSRGEVFNFLLDALGAFLMFVSDNGRILYCSDLITSLTGHMPTRLVGQTIYDCIVPEDEAVLRSQFVPLANTTGEKIPESPIVAFPPRKFACSMRLYSNDPSSMSISRNFVCLSYLRQWTEDKSLTTASVDFTEEACSSDTCNGGPSSSSCILLLGKLGETDRPRDYSVTTNDVNFEFSMRVSKEGKILEVDKQASLILGYTKADIQGASFFDYIDPYHSEKIGEAIEMFLSKGLGVSQPYRLSSKSGQYIWVVSKGFLSYNPWNHKPDHVLLQCKVLGCDEVLPEYKFKVDSMKIPNPMEDYSPTVSKPHPPQIERTDVIVQAQSTQTPFVSDNNAIFVNGGVSSASLTAANPDPILFPPSVSLETPSITGEDNIHDMAKQLERKNQELFELQRRMLEQQQLFERERQQFYQVTNQVMTYIGKNEVAGTQPYIDPNMSIAIGNSASSQQTSLLSGPPIGNKMGSYFGGGEGGGDIMKPPLYQQTNQPQSFNSQPSFSQSQSPYSLNHPQPQTMYSQARPEFTLNSQVPHQQPYPNYSLPNSLASPPIPHFYGNITPQTCTSSSYPNSSVQMFPSTKSASMDMPTNVNSLPYSCPP